MLHRVYGLPTDASAEWLSAAVDCAEIRSANISNSALSLLVIHAILEASQINGTNGTLGTSMTSKPVASVSRSKVRNI